MGEPSDQGRDLGTNTKYRNATMSSRSPHCQAEHKVKEPDHIPQLSQSLPFSHPPMASSKTKKKLKQCQVIEQISTTLDNGENS